MGASAQRDTDRAPPGRAARIGVALLGAALAVAALRLAAGLGPVTALNDGYAFGLWRALNVATIAGAGAGALFVALAVHVVRRGAAHPVVRSALLVGTIAHGIAALSALVDLGRWWRAWALFAHRPRNVDALPLEAALFLGALGALLWLEVLPGVLERRAGPSRRARAASRAQRTLATPVLALAAALPLAHQATLGALLGVTAPKLHPLWQGRLVPALFVLSSLVLGLAAAIVAETVAHLASGRALDRRLLARLAGLLAGAALAFLAVRGADLLAAGSLPRAIAGWPGVLFLAEGGLLLWPAAALLDRRRRENAGDASWAAQVALAGAALYRIDAHLCAFCPAGGFAYVPALGELVFSAGLAAGGAALFAVASRRLPAPRRAPRERRAGRATLAA